MSLKGSESRILGIEHQRGEHRGIEPGADPVPGELLIPPDVLRN